MSGSMIGRGVRPGGAISTNIRRSIGTLAEVQGWFAENGVEYVRTYPSALLGGDPFEEAELFSPAQDTTGGWKAGSPR
jgi:hypothetical protein